MRIHTRAWLRSRNLLTREPSSTLLQKTFPLKASHPNYICQCSRVSPRDLVSPTSVAWVCSQTVSWRLIKQGLWQVDHRRPVMQARAALTEFGITVSMSRTGNCYDHRLRGQNDELEKNGPTYGWPCDTQFPQPLSGATCHK